MIGFAGQQFADFIIPRPESFEAGIQGKNRKRYCTQREYQVTWYGGVVAREQYIRSVQPIKITAFRL